MKGGWVYIMTNWAFGSFYVGVTNDLTRRIREHKEGVNEGHTKRYQLHKLVFAERHESILAAIQREKNIKHWSREWKIRLIMAENPNWDDLFDGFSG
jgi:putative endonuclease